MKPVAEQYTFQAPGLMFCYACIQKHKNVGYFCYSTLVIQSISNQEVMNVYEDKYLREKVNRIARQKEGKIIIAL